MPHAVPVMFCASRSTWHSAPAALCGQHLLISSSHPECNGFGVSCDKTASRPSTTFAFSSRHCHCLCNCAGQHYRQPVCCSQQTTTARRWFGRGRRTSASVAALWGACKPASHKHGRHCRYTSATGQCTLPAGNSHMLAACRPSHCTGCGPNQVIIFVAVLHALPYCFCLHI